jgi:phage replication-related protein YjqB (UPF0714/DUF867 family)
MCIIIVVGDENMIIKEYLSFYHLRHEEKEGLDYSIQCFPRDSDVVVIAPHGGEIEPGTTEIAKTIASDRFSFYTLEGLKPQGNKRLHIASNHFDEDRAYRIVQASQLVVAIHGCCGYVNWVFIGGLALPERKRIAQSLRGAGFQVEIYPPKPLAGEHKNNICNGGINGKGIQIEIDKSIRETMFRSLSKDGREETTIIFDRFVEAIRSNLEEYVSS